MRLARFLVEAVVFGKQSPNRLVREHPISRGWFYELLARYRRDGLAALESKSHRPAACPHQVDQTVVDAILELRAELSAAGLDAGPQTILHHLTARFPSPPSRVTVWRILKRQGLITPEPHKRPKASFVRFEAELPNELWQTDATEWHLADSSKVEILNSSTTTPAFAWLRSPFARSRQQTPSKPSIQRSPNTDHRLVSLATMQPSSVAAPAAVASPSRQAPAESIVHLQLQLDAFRTIYNQQRPHRALDGRTPLQAFNSRLKASPSATHPQLDYRIRRDRLDAEGRVTLRYLSRLRHFHVSYKHRRQDLVILVAGAHVRVITEDGALLRELTLDPTRDYQRSTAPTLVRHQVRQRSAST
jgi:transposase InsO family protein